MVVLDDLAIYHHCMHVSTPSLKHNMPVGVEQWEHHWRLIILNQDEIGLFVWCDTADDVVHPQCSSATKRRPIDNLLGSQMTEHDSFVALVRFHMLTGPVCVECRAHRGEQICAPPHAGVHR